MKSFNGFKAACYNIQVFRNRKNVIFVSPYTSCKRKKLHPLVFVAVLFILILTPFYGQAQVSLSNFKTEAQKPGVNYYQLVTEVRAKLELKKRALIAQGIDVTKYNPYHEEVAQFERWALEWRDKIGVDGLFPNPLTGWVNAMQQNPAMFISQQNLQVPNLISTTPWTSLGPVNSGTLNGWSFGGGIGRINVVKRHPLQPATLFAGATAGGVFKSTDFGNSWTPITDQFSGLGVSDLAFLPTNSNHMILATGDFDGKHVNSIGIFKSTDGGNTWVNKLPFTLGQQIRIAHVYADPNFAVNNTFWATGGRDIYRSADQGENWVSVYNNPAEEFNDFIKVGTTYIASGLLGSLFTSPDGNAWTQVYNHAAGAESRIDFAHSPNTPDVLYILTKSNPAFAKYTISTNTMGAFSAVTNSVPADGNADFNTQESYNQVIAVNPTNGNDIILGEFSGKRSVNGGTTWVNHLNGYYTTTGPANWGGGYVHSDIHYLEFVGAANDSLLIGNDGGVYMGPVNNTPFAYVERLNGLVCTQSYSISIFGAEPNNIMIGNQDNDGRSRNFVTPTATWYAAQAGDGISTAIHRTNKDIRFLTGTTGTLSYRNDAFVATYAGQSIGKPNNGVFAAPLEMHLSNGNILYGAYSDVYKSIGIIPSGDPNIPDNANWVNLNSGLGDKPKFIGLANHPTDAAKQRIVAIGDNNVIRKTTDETTWVTITPPAGVLFNSIYWSRNTDTMLATARGYAAANKIFFSPNAGATWINYTDNMPNIAMANIIRYEGTDTVFAATELGVYFARLNPAGGVLAGWAKFGTGLPNVKVTDMEISYPKKQIFISSFGRGVWMSNLTLAVLAASDINFSYKTYNANNYSLNWKIEASDIFKTVLEKSTDGRTFTPLQTFTGAEKKDQPGYLVPKENRNIYYRLHYINASGKILNSQIVLIRGGNGSANFITVYPNPTSEFVHITSTTKMATVKIVTITGQQLTYAQPQSNYYSFDMSLLPKGVFVVQVWDVNGNMSSEKIIRN